MALLERIRVLSAMRPSHAHTTHVEAEIFPLQGISANIGSASWITTQDAELVARCQQDGHAAWEELVDRFQRYVFAISTQVFRLSQQDAEDVFQTVFEAVYVGLKKGAWTGPELRPWIGKITRTKCIDSLRKSSRIEPTDEELTPPGETETMEAIDRALDVHDALGQLSETCREMLDRFFARDESYRTIGEQLDLPSGTVASRISRCLDKLRGEFMEESENPTRLESG